MDILSTRCGNYSGSNVLTISYTACHMMEFTRLYAELFPVMCEGTTTVYYLLLRFNVGT